ncbi:MAG: TRAP transporter small permease [Pseudomonadota bacterium]
MPTRFQRVCQNLAFAPSLLAAATLFALMVMTFSDVMLRSIFNAPIEAATELTRIFMAIIVFSSLPIISARGGHIVVDIIDPLFKGAVARLRDGIIFIITGALLIWPTQRCYVLAERARDFGDLTEYLAIPQYLITYFITISTGITALVLIVTGLVTLFAPSLIDYEGGASSESEPS